MQEPEMVDAPHQHCCRGRLTPCDDQPPLFHAVIRTPYSRPDSLRVAPRADARMGVPGGVAAMTRFTRLARAPCRWWSALCGREATILARPRRRAVTSRARRAPCASRLIPRPWTRSRELLHHLAGVE